MKRSISTVEHLKNLWISKHIIEAWAEEFQQVREFDDTR